MLWFGSTLDLFKVRRMVVLHDHFTPQIGLHLGNVVLEHCERRGRRATDGMAVAGYAAERRAVELFRRY